ncbi:uncharacterized protein EDB91DRAFT_1301101 [Suillus paluster]|uniref:uncharacterized protein n=1 Tax=Suillus paluster TaxID=48578 RepID=UPI001B862108|nr:uncharacterized protein EDB91DRAFT_1301101 [Suillus paluster]KAG1733046.1 hypothetical protein EDB91DRAFT_1301101 [Suillus paluster]
MSSSTQDLIPQIDLRSTFGALFIGVIVAAVLFGATNVQAFVYFQTHRDTGRTFYKLVVIWLWILDTLHLALIIHCVYYYLVINYANIGALTDVVWSFKLQIIIDVFIVYGVHVLYVHRLWIVSKGRSRVLPIIVGIIVVLVSGVAITLMWAIYQCHVFADLVTIEWSTYMTLGTITFLDIIIASSLCYFLATSRTGFSGTDSLVTKLMGYIVNTGCLTRYSSFEPIPYLDSYLVQYVFNGSYDYSEVTTAVSSISSLRVTYMAKLYVNSFLALLNAPYYLQSNTGTVDSSMRHGVYRPELHHGVSQDEESQTSRKNMMVKHPDDEVAVHPIPSVMPQGPLEVMVEMNSFSSV